MSIATRLPVRRRRAASPCTAGASARARFRRTLRKAWAAEPAPPPCGPRARLRALARRHLLPLALYALIAAVMTFPLVLHLPTHIPSDGGDALQHYWDLWWVRTALFAGHNPFRTPLLYAPNGAPLYLHTLNLFNGLVSLPVQLAFGLVPAYNAVVFVSFALAGYFAYLLVAHVSGSRRAGFVGGVIYAFGSYHMTHLLGHTNLLASEWLPAYVLCLLRANETAGRRRTLFVAASVGALLLTMLCDWQYVLFAAFFTAVYAGYAALTRRSLAPLAIAALIGVGWAVAALPLLIPTVAEIRSGVTSMPDLGTANAYSADLSSFVVPSPLHSWWGAWAARLHEPLAVPPVEGAVFLGYLPLALAGLGARWSWRRASFWALATLVFLLLALGPYLHVGGAWRFGQARWSVPLPDRLLLQLPALNVTRVPVRYSLMVTLCLAVLAGLGCAGIGRRLPGAVGPRLRAALLAVLVAALLAEHLAVPYPLEAVSAPAFYQQLARSPEQGAILEWPFSLKRAASNYYQTIHGRPIVGGYMSRKLRYTFRFLPPLSGVDDIAPDIYARQGSPGLGAWALRYAGVRWIVVYLDDPLLDREDLPQFLQRYAEQPPIYQDAQMAVYRPLPPGEPTSYLLLDQGWYALERLPDTRTRMRWFASAARVTAWTFGAEPQAYTLRFDAWTFHRPRRLEVRVDGRVVGQWQVADVQRFDIPLTLGMGEHTIELRSLDPPTSPVSVGLSTQDTRPLAFAISNFELRR